MEINWYPGHMAKAKRQLSEQLKRVDVVIELCDARLPRASRNPDLDKMLEHKQRVLVFGKSDLADPVQTDKWVKYYRDQGILCIAVNMNKQAKQVSQLIDKATEETVRRAAERGIKKTIRDYGVDEREFLNRLDDMVEQAFDDQCTGANPRYPLMSELKQMYLNAYYGV